MRRNGAGSAAHFFRDIAAGWYTSGIAIATGDGELPGGFPDPETIALTDYNFTIHDVYDFDPKTKYKSVTNKVVAVMALAQKRGVIRSYPVVISV